jgi:hypothetical protein
MLLRDLSWKGEYPYRSETSLGNRARIVTYDHLADHGFAAGLEITIS